MSAKRILCIDCQLLQSGAIHRGMGKYTLAVLEEYLSATMPYEKIVIILSEHRTNDSDEAFIESTLSKFEIVRLDLNKTNPAKPEGYEAILEANRRTIDSFVADALPGYTVDFLIASLFHEDGCSAFPTHAENKYLLVYDLIPLQFPDYYLQDARGKYQYLSRLKELFRVTHYFTISKTVANDMSLQLGISLKRITPIDGSYISRKKLRAKKPAVMSRDDTFILMPTGDDARKNNLRAVTAFEEFNSKSGYGYKLVITSFFGDKSKSELNLQSNHLVFTGNVSEPEIAWLYEHAELILFPSEYEGLGMPPLEAVEFGKPVLCSSIDVFKEISEKAFNFCDPYSVDDMSRQLQRLLIGSSSRPSAAEYNRILKEYTWKHTAERMIKTYLSEQANPKPAPPKKSRVAVFAPDPSGYSAIGMAVQQQHYELSQIADVDYYLESGITDRAKSSMLRMNYLAYVANCRNPWNFDKKIAARYDKIIYHIGNSEYHIATIIKALVYPGTVVLHDTQIRNIFSLIKDRGYISPARFEQEERFDVAVAAQNGQPRDTTEASFTASLVNSSKRVIVHSRYAQQHVESVVLGPKDSKVQVLRLNLPTPVPFEVYASSNSEVFTIGYAGILHQAKGLNLIEEIARHKYAKPLAFKLFGFSLVDDDTIKAIEALGNVDIIVSPSDARFIHELEACDVILGFRTEYHGETSLSTIESLRLGRAVIVNDVGWFAEIPEDIVYKVKTPKDIIELLKERVASGESPERSQARAEYIKQKHNIADYINALAGA